MSPQDARKPGRKICLLLGVSKMRVTDYYLRPTSDVVASKKPELTKRLQHRFAADKIHLSPEIANFFHLYNRQEYMYGRPSHR